jgi:group I intron endonuclease
MQTGRIYLLTNKVNGKKYVGQTSNALETRWIKHKSAAKAGKKLPILRAIRKYGPESFTIEVIAESLRPFLNDLERFFIRLCRSQTTQHGYNRTEGGDGVAMKPSEETLAKMRGRKLSKEHIAKLRARKFSDETRAKMSAARKGKKSSQEHIAKMTGWKHSDEARAKIGAAGLGRKLSDETRAKMSSASKARKGRKLSNEHRANISAAQVGRKFSEETRAKMSAAKLGKKGAKQSDGLNMPLNFPQQQAVA